MPQTTRSLAAAGIAGLVLATMAVVPAAAAPGSPHTRPATPDRTSRTEARRVDSVPTPKLDWYACYDYAECATARLPLDYDKPKGATTEVALLRVKARNQQARIGSLFLNPGGPGGSGTDIALAAPSFLGDDLLDRFDIVGVDPRGVAASDNVKCFPSVKEQTRAYAGLNVAFPWTKAEEKAYLKSAKAVGQACSTTGRPLTSAMSTAEVARDMDVLRRAVGDQKLSYLGFSYGTALGQYYATMFPDRVRAVVVDGVLNPDAWVGQGKARDQLQETRLRSADGAYRALREILVRCAKAGPQACPSPPPVTRSPPTTGGEAAAAEARGDRRPGRRLVHRQLRRLRRRQPQRALQPLRLGADRGQHRTAAHHHRSAVGVAGPPRRGACGARPDRRTGACAARFDFPYSNGLETFLSVDCTDAYHPKKLADWPALARQEDKRAPYFGRLWAWGTAPCARDAWTVRDADAYTGPFDRRTAAPVLVVGNYWDPATNYQGAVTSAQLLPNSRLLSSDSWGHTAYGTSACVTGAVDAYLLRGALPAKGTVCVGDVQPFVETPEPAERAASDKSALAAAGLPARGAPKRLPPVVAPLPLVGSLTVR